MPKNIRGGKHSKKGKNSGPGDGMGPGPIEYPDSEQYYGAIVKKLGNNQLDLLIAQTGDKRGMPARGLVRPRVRREWRNIHEGAILIVSLRPFEKLPEPGEDKRMNADVLHVYHPDHIKQLIRANKLPAELVGIVTSADEKRKLVEAKSLEEGGFEFDAGDAEPEEEEVDIDDI